MKQLVRFDWAMKRLLRQKANFVILEGFLSELLGEDLQIRNLLESEGNKESEFDKYNRVDMLVESKKRRELMLIEVQNSMQYDYFQRMLYGVSKLVTEYLREREAYAKIRKIYSVNIVYFDIGHGEDYLYHGTTNFVGLHQGDKLELSVSQRMRYKRQTIASLYPEYYLIKVNQFNDIAKNTLDEWIYFLKNEEINEDTRAKGLPEAKRTLDMLKLPEKERKDYKQYVENLHFQASMAETEEAMKSEGRAEGRAEGRVEEKKATARKMLEDGLDAAMVMKYTGLTPDDLAALTSGATQEK